MFNETAYSSSDSSGLGLTLAQPTPVKTTIRRGTPTKGLPKGWIGGQHPTTWQPGSGIVAPGLQAPTTPGTTTPTTTTPITTTTTDSSSVLPSFDLGFLSGEMMGIPIWMILAAVAAWFFLKKR